MFLSFFMFLIFGQILYHPGMPYVISFWRVSLVFLIIYLPVSGFLKHGKSRFDPSHPSLFLLWGSIFLFQNIFATSPKNNTKSPKNKQRKARKRGFGSFGLSKDFTEDEKNDISEKVNDDQEKNYTTEESVYWILIMNDY